MAGPITLAAFIAPLKLRAKLIKILGGKIKDSKQFSDKRRREIYKNFLRLKKAGKIFFQACHISNKIIDEKGINYATNQAIKNVLVNTKRSASNIDFFNKNCTVRLDGLLKAPKEFKNQKTIIRGDESDIFIACASIVAKVCRDRLMRRLAKKYPNYGFEIHKGYGTALHYKLIKKYGLSSLHRKSFCKRLTK